MEQTAWWYSKYRRARGRSSFDGWYGLDQKNLPDLPIFVESCSNICSDIVNEKEYEKNDIFAIFEGESVVQPSELLTSANFLMVDDSLNLNHEPSIFKYNSKPYKTFFY